MKKKFFKKTLSVTLAMSMVMATPVMVGAEEASADLKSGLVAEYLFDGNYIDYESKYAAATELGDGNTLVSNESERKNVVQLSGGVIPVTVNGDFQEKNTIPSGLLMPSDIINKTDYSKGLTMSMWLKSTAANGFSSIADISDQNGPYSWGHIEFAAAPQFRYNGWNLNEMGGDDFFDVGTWPADVTYWLGDSGWEMFTVTVDDSGITLYVDKDVLYTDTDTTHAERILKFLTALAGSGRGSLKLGCFITPGNFNWNWDAYAGYMDDIRIYNKALSAEEVSALYALDPDTSVTKEEDRCTGKYKRKRFRICNHNL